MNAFLKMNVIYRYVKLFFKNCLNKTLECKNLHSFQNIFVYV